MGHDNSTPRYALRDLPLAARLVLSAFLLSVGLGSSAALVRLHFKHATKGEFLPSAKDAERIFHGSKPKPKIEALLDDDSSGWGRNASMRPAFMEKSSGWKELVERRAKR